MILRCVFLLALLLTGCGQPKQQLHIYIWSEYIDPEIVADFERQFDCKVTVDLYEDADSMIAKLGAGGASLYDIVVPSNLTVPGLVKRGLLAPLRHQNISNLTNVSSAFRHLAFDPENAYSVPYQWGTTGLYLRRSKAKPVEETWGLLFEASRQAGPFLMIDDARHCLGGALKYKGHSLNSTNPAELLEARDLILEAKKRSLGFEGTVGGKNRVLARGAVLAFVVNGDAARGVTEDPETYYFVPREGGEIFLDTLSIPAQAPHRELAEKFINFILDPKVGARLSNFNQFATPNQASLPFINPTDLNNPAIYPPQAIRSQLEYANDLGDANKLYNEIWTQIKSR
ncbi:MAG: spermidine/putrescine ABC transporter substrate-binding protein [Verrucomicrobiota bacterium]